MENAAEPVTVIITRILRAGSESAFEDAVKAFIPQALAFDGHLGVHMLRPLPEGREYGAVLKFRSHHDWAAFLRWPGYLSFLAAIEPYLDAPPQVETLSGLESWFTPTGTRAARMPPRWKMALVTWIGVCLMVYMVNVVLSWSISEWPQWVRFLLGNALVVAGLTWAIMPALTWLFQRWLLPASQEISSYEPSTPGSMHEPQTHDQTRGFT